MNDPGLDGPIDDAYDQVRENVIEAKDEEHPEEEMDEEEEVKNFLMPSRWWYASTGFPLIAGTFGPMANAFSVCALVENWRVSIPPGGTEEHGEDIKDPGWLIAVNAVSLVCALIANMSLLLNMARRVPFKIAQPITILGFWVASILLIALIAVASHNFHAPGVQNQALTQAYYYAIFAAGLYQLISYLMCCTVYGAYKGYYSREFKLTVAQRTLMLQTIAFLVYLLLGALVYSKIEGWKFLDAVFWADFTTLTIGIGDDYTPSTHLGRSLLFPFAMGGIIILGLVVGSIRSLVLDRGKKKMSARLTEKTRARLVKQIEKATQKRDKQRKTIMGMKGDTAAALQVKPGEDKIAELDRRAAEFEAMRNVQATAATKRKYMSLAVSTFAFAFLWTIGALVFWRAERNQDWSYFEAFYFSYTTLLTIGYGDLQPISNSGKPFFVFWSLLAVPSLTILISDMGDTVVKTIKDVTIWLGEITVLPSDENSTKERLKHGIYKATLGKAASPHEDVENGSEEGGESGFQELHPGLTKLFKRGGRRQGPDKKDRANQDHMAKDFEDAEKKDEDDARNKGDRWEEDEHHYRHVLISAIRRVYADTTASTPKEYRYDEWVYFLRLLGEDEHDASAHRHAAEIENETNRQQALEMSGQEGAFASGSDKAPNKKGEKVKWSWIGNRSPLMGDKEEAEWLLEKLFIRLEESLRGEGNEKEEQVKGETKRNHPNEDGKNEQREATEKHMQGEEQKKDPEERKKRQKNEDSSENTMTGNE
ncbi:hypothetical protein PV11_07957 [Exophiala sideris]|uniref:Potassium channel domain-containing protein n=1 Tax=Exophiala sideris TaxID=1016849 RepID=A0A0D1YHL5_9EURO|nr:hypothetical protein PV11_07957 [Exophiala sideris]